MSEEQRAESKPSEEAAAFRAFVQAHIRETANLCHTILDELRQLRVALEQFIECQTYDVKGKR